MVVIAALILRLWVRARSGQKDRVQFAAVLRPGGFPWLLWLTRLAVFAAGLATGPGAPRRAGAPREVHEPSFIGAGGPRLEGEGLKPTRLAGARVSVPRGLWPVSCSPAALTPPQLLCAGLGGCGG